MNTSSYNRLQTFEFKSIPFTLGAKAASLMNMVFHGLDYSFEESAVINKNEM